MAHVELYESGISCSIEFVADSPDGEYLTRIIDSTKSDSELQIATFNNLDDVLSWIGKVFPEYVARWKANRQFPYPFWLFPDPSRGNHLRRLHRTAVSGDQRALDRDVGQFDPAAGPENNLGQVSPKSIE